MSNTKENILAYSRILSNKKDNVPSRDNSTDGTNAIINDSVDGNPDAVPTSEETAQQKVSVYNPTSSESHKQMVEDVEQKAIAKAEENKDNPPPFETDNPPTNYKEMLKRFFREKIAGKGLTPEQREKREMRLAKIQDGISAIANLIAATQGAGNSYTGQNTRTENTRKKWEDFYKKRKQEERDVYVDQMRALKLEEAIRNRNKAIEEEEKPTSRSPISRESSNNTIQTESEAVKQDQNNSDEAPTTYQIQGESSTDKNGDIPKTVSANTQQTPSANGQKEVKNNILRGNKVANISSNKGGSKNNRIGFVDDLGNEIAINKDVWRGSMQQIFNILIDEGIGKQSYQDQERYKQNANQMSQSQKEDFVKQNWNKSNRAKSHMLNLAEKDPNKYKSKISDSEDYSQYEVTADEDYSQYEIKK